MKKISGNRIRAWRFVLFILISLIIGGNLYMWNARLFFGNVMPMPFGFGVYTMNSESMIPLLNKNDLILVHKTEVIEEGDVIACQNGRGLEIQRVTEIVEEVVQAKADAVDKTEITILMSDVKGKVIAWIPKIGKWLKLAESPVCVITILAAAWTLVEITYYVEKESASKK